MLFQLSGPLLLVWAELLFFFSHLFFKTYWKATIMVPQIASELGRQSLSWSISNLINHFKPPTVNFYAHDKVNTECEVDQNLINRFAMIKRVGTCWLIAVRFPFIYKQLINSAKKLHFKSKRWREWQMVGDEQKWRKFKALGKIKINWIFAILLFFSLIRSLSTKEFKPSPVYIIFLEDSFALSFIWSCAMQIWRLL